MFKLRSRCQLQLSLYELHTPDKRSEFYSSVSTQPAIAAASRKGQSNGQMGGCMPTAEVNAPAVWHACTSCLQVRACKLPGHLSRFLGFLGQSESHLNAQPIVLRVSGPGARGGCTAVQLLRGKGRGGWSVGEAERVRAGMRSSSAPCTASNPTLCQTVCSSQSQTPPPALPPIPSATLPAP